MKKGSRIGKGITAENEEWLNKLMRQYRDKFIKLNRKYEPLKRTLHLIIDTCIIQSNEIADCKGEIKKLKLKLKSK